MNCNEASFTRANLIHGYLAGSFVEANFAGALLAYTQLSQSDLTGADLTGALLLQSTAVKSDFDSTTLVGVIGQFFAFRCEGLDDALAAGDLYAQTTLRSLMASLEELMNTGPRTAM